MKAFSNYKYALLNYIKTSPNEIGFFVKLKCQKLTVASSVGI